MYEVLLKRNDRGTSYEKIGRAKDYKNCLEKATSIVLNLIDYFNGYSYEEDYFKDSHPSSTQNTPKFYCIANNNVFKIFEHQKLNGWFFSEHYYIKRFTIKIIKSYEREFEPDLEYHNKKRFTFDIMDNVIKQLKKIPKEDLKPSSINVNNFEPNLEVRNKSEELPHKISHII